MPGVFAGDNFDVSGFVLGVVERSEMIDTSKIEEGDVLIGVPSNGLHTNGYSLVRHVYGLDSDPSPLYEFRSELGETLGDALLRPHTPYYNQLKPVFGMSQGHRPRHRRRPDRKCAENAARRPLGSRFDTDSWPVPSDLHARYKQDGFISRDEMYRVFNMGLGMVLACDRDRVSEVLGMVPDAVEVGKVVSGEGGGRVML